MHNLRAYLNKIFCPSSHLVSRYGLTPELIKYAENSYPSNHTYRIMKDHLYPKRKLRKRLKTFSKLYPQPLTSLLDVGCSKGFFVFDASRHTSCQRSLGIDITEKEITFCNKIKDHLREGSVQFALLRLDELADRIDQFGGAFQTILVINIYQYLYFGSDHFSKSYLDHDVIFRNLSRICTDRIIFNNRINVEDCQNQSWILRSGSRSQFYSEEYIRCAAEKYFIVEDHGTFGRYPLWLLKKIVLPRSDLDI